MVLEAASEPESLAQGHARQSIISESVCLLLTELRPQVSPGPLCCVLPSESQVPAQVPSREIFGVSLQNSFGLASSFKGNLA